MRNTTIPAIGRVLLAGVMFAGFGATAARGVTLRWKLKAGETLHYVLDQKTTTTVTAAGKSFQVALTQTIEMGRAVTDVQPDGTADLTQTFDRLRSKIETPFGTFAYDSNDAKEPESAIARSQAALFKVLVGARFTFKMSPQGELSDIKVPDPVIKALREAGAGAGASGGAFSEDSLKNMIRESSLELPREDLVPGKSWTRQIKTPSPFGSMKLVKTYRYQGPETKTAHLEVIGMEMKTSVEPSSDPNVSLEIKSQDSRGSFSFDPAAGRIVESHVTDQMETTETFMNVELNRSVETSTVMKLVRIGGAQPPR
jgi:hypothetical protein